MKKLFFLLGFIFFSSAIAFGQFVSIKQYEKAIESAIAQKNYRAAYEYAKVVFVERPERFDLVRLYAKSARLYKAFHKAQEGYQILIDNNQVNETDSVLYWMGMVLKNQGFYVAADSMFQRFRGEHPDASEELRLSALREIEASRWADSVQQDVQLRRENSEYANFDTLIYITDSTINSPWTDFAPFWDGTDLHFSSLRSTYTKPKDDYKPARPLTKVFKADGLNNADLMGGSFNQENSHTVHYALSPNGERVYYTICDYVEKTLDISCEIFFSNKTGNDRWGAPKSVGPFVNANGAHMTNPSVAQMEDSKLYLFYSSNREGGKGGYDIWYVELLEDGTTADNPKNILEVNTKYDEFTPSFDPVNKYLYFSSNGYKNMGGFDTYRSLWLDGTIFTTENLGPGINSSFDDMYFTVDTSGYGFFFASNRKGVNALDDDSKTCCMDIYKGKLKEPIVLLDLTALCPKGTVVNDVVFTVINRKTGFEESFPSEDGKLNVKLRGGYIYDITLSKPDFKSASGELDLTELERGTTEKAIELTLVPLVSDLEITVFDKTSNDVISGAKVELLDEGNNVITELISAADGRVLFPRLDAGGSYQIRTSKPEFTTKTEDVQMPTDLCEPLVYQKPTFITIFGKIKLYFDNDEPGPHRRGVSASDENYESSWFRYYGDESRPNLKPRKDEFFRQYTTGSRMCPQGKFSEQDLVELDSFFENEVKKGMDDLKKFEVNLKDYLDALKPGEQLTISIEGHASPRAKSDYNIYLTDRRISSVRQYLRSVFEDAIRDNKLNVIPKSFGEDNPLTQGVPSEDDDDCLSEYGIPASRERRVDILEVIPEGSTEILAPLEGQ